MELAQIKQLGPRVLLAGMHTIPNQFTRALEAIGVRVEWFGGEDGNTRRSFPRFCEAVVIAKCQLSHKYFWEIKEAYGTQHKPVFIADHSYSTIRSAVEQWVAEWKRTQSPGTVLEQALLAAAAPAATSEVPEPVPVPVPEPEVLVSGKSQYAPDVKAKLHRVITECTQAKMDMPATLEMLRLEGLTLSDGRPIKAMHVYGIRSIIRHYGAMKAPVQLAPTPAPAPVPTPIRAPGVFGTAVFDQILQSTMRPARKVELLARLQSGALAQVDILWFLDVLKETP